MSDEHSPGDVVRIIIVKPRLVGANVSTLLEFAAQFDFNWKEAPDQQSACAIEIGRSDFEIWVNAGMPRLICPMCGGGLAYDIVTHQPDCTCGVYPPKS